MIKINFPEIDCENFYSICLLSISNRKQEYKNKLTSISDEIEDEWTNFNESMLPKRFHLFTPCEAKKPNQIISHDVTKKELMDLYSVHMCKKESEPRQVYDILRATAKNGICPLCGINGVATLDHYLPKSRYPMHSVNPKNLIPACENCNKGKGSQIFHTEYDQTLYPYNDENKFYNTDWVFSRITRDGTLIFEFFARPPDHWSLNEHKRVITHFEGYELSHKYAINSAQFVTTIINMIKHLLINGDHIIVREHFEGLANDVPANSTLRAMYMAIVLDEAVCNGEF